MADWFTETFAKEFARQESALGQFNLAVFGKTGVGKSTLINAVFGAEVAATGIGKPVTSESHLYLHQGQGLGLIDTVGVEVGRDDKLLHRDLEAAVKKLRSGPENQHLHAAWYCVRGMDRRFEDSEEAFVRTLDELGVPTFLVLTQVPRKDDVYHPDAVALQQHIESLNLPIVGGHPFMTFSMRDQFSDQSPYGLIELLNATFRSAPEAVQGALAQAQKIDLRLKASQAQKVIGAATASAAAAAVVPIPFSDAAMLVPIQLGMFAKVAQLHNVRFDRAAMLAIASTAAATSAGRSVFTNLLKFIPGAGSVTGGVLSAGVASAFTAALGQAWLVVCQRAAAGKLPELDGVIDTVAVKNLFQQEFGKRMPSVRHDVDGGPRVP